MNRNRRVAHMKLIKEVHEQPHMRDEFDEFGVRVSKRVTSKRRKNSKGKFIEPVWIGNKIAYGCA